MTPVTTLAHERNLCEQELIETQLQYNDCCDKCRPLKQKIEELTKKLKSYDKQLAKRFRIDSTS